MRQKAATQRHSMHSYICATMSFISQLESSRTQTLMMQRPFQCATLS